MAPIVVLDDDAAALSVVERILTRAAYRVAVFTDPQQCFTALMDLAPAAVCLDLHIPGYGDTEVLQAVRRLVPDAPVVMLTGDEQPSSVVAAMRHGAYDYLAKPLDGERLLLTLAHAISERGLVRRVKSLERESGVGKLSQVFGRSPVMLDCMRQLESVADREVAVLLHGETGTGKAQMARALHDFSSRRHRPFLAMSLSTIPEDLQAPMLFGYAHGSARGAVASRTGLLDQVMGGTLLLRDVAELGPVAQAGLLHVLDHRAFLRVGGKVEVPIDVRLVASTSHDLGPEVTARRFRAALHLRISAFDLRVPSLREHPDDILPLAVGLLRKHAEALQRSPLTLGADAAGALLSYRWPGNLRELSNAMQRAAIVAEAHSVSVLDLPAYVRPTRRAESVELSGAAIEDVTRGDSMAHIQRRAIYDALARHSGNVAAASRDLGIGRATLYRKARAFARDKADTSA